jgi:hypothetical protein
MTKSSTTISGRANIITTPIAIFAICLPENRRNTGPGGIITGIITRGWGWNSPLGKGLSGGSSIGSEWGCAACLLLPKHQIFERHSSHLPQFTLLLIDAQPAFPSVIKLHSDLEPGVGLIVLHGDGMMVELEGN